MNISCTGDACCGCGACQAVCPKDAIHFSKNKEGFLCPVIAPNKCVDCSLCVKVCAVEKSEALKKKPLSCYGAVNKDPEVLNKSTSGGVFSAVAYSVLDERGVIYGAASVENIIKHIRITERSKLQLLRGSKYVQSDFTGAFSQIKEDLQAGIMVMVVGTPCQCAGLKKCLDLKRIDYSKLLLVDFICHGVVSPGVFRDYITYASHKAKKKIAEHRFREKCSGWRSHTEANYFEDGTCDYTSFTSQLFKSCFHSHLINRSSCYECRFASEARVSDITIADFWGVQKSHPEFMNTQGTSAVLVNTELGKRYFAKASTYLNTCSINITDMDQPQLDHPIKVPDQRQAFWKDYEKGFKYVAVKYFHAGKIRRFLVGAVKAVLKK